VIGSLSATEINDVVLCIIQAITMWSFNDEERESEYMSKFGEVHRLLYANMEYKALQSVRRGGSGEVYSTSCLIVRV
jgi:hypothetical protein